MLFCPSMKICILFPGQGAQYPGMGKDLWAASQAVRDLFHQASDSAGMDIEKLLFEGTAEDLQATDKTQVAITLVNLAAAAMLLEKGIGMDGCAGFSLGEYAALYAASVISLEDLFPIVKLRGELMERASRGLDSPSGKPGMAAVLGLSSDIVTSTIGPLSSTGVYAANHNSPSQMVLSGTQAGLAQAETALKTAGARRVIRLKVSGPFHSPLLSEAATAFSKALEGYDFSDPKIPLFSNVTGKRITSGNEARDLCGKQIVSMVRWVTVEESLLSEGFDRFMEAGPGSVLTGLFKALKPDVSCQTAGKMEDIDKIVASIR
jgi:[acyl-carrier-protein] S-malonyltransferase